MQNYSEFFSSSSEKWLVVNTIHHREIYACEHLVRQDFHVYCPMITKRVKHARRAYDASRPLFPGYIFVEYRSQRETWRPILGTHGVKSLVRTGGQPSLLSGGFIDSLKARESDEIIRKPETPLQIGQDVAVRGGPLDGLIGKIMELRDNERVLVLLNLLDQQTKTHLHADMLSPI
jgi:transcriptional antiterminator RfaH